MRGEKSIEMCCNVYIFHMQVMDSKNDKRKNVDDIKYFQTIRELDDEPATAQYIDITCKVGK